MFVLENQEAGNCNGQIKWTTSYLRNGLVMDNLMDSTVKCPLGVQELVRKK